LTLFQPCPSYILAYCGYLDSYLLLQLCTYYFFNFKKDLIILAKALILAELQVDLHFIVVFEANDLLSLIYEPNPNRFDVGTRGVIRFGSGDPRSYHNHMIRYRKLLSGEYNNTNTSIPKCAVVIGAVDGAPTNESVCDVEPGSPQLYGPCVLTM
ncbi:hypothetical protein TELCIR_04960, partial [Teladorsagia circumcincta]